MDTIFITGLKLDVVIGVHPWEQRIRQRLLLDLELATDIRPAAASDDLADTVDYQALSERLCAHAASSRLALIETLAEQLAAIVRDEFGVSWLRLRLHKPDALSQAADVGVCIERGQR